MIYQIPTGLIDELISHLVSDSILPAQLNNSGNFTPRAPTTFAEISKEVFC